MAKRAPTSTIGQPAPQPSGETLPVHRTPPQFADGERGSGSIRNLIRVLVVDHETLLRHGVRSIVQSAPDIEIVGEAATSDDAIKQSISLCPDVLLIESHLPDGAGIAAIRTIKQGSPLTRILVLTSRGDPASFTQAAAAGAIGYILKDIASEHLLNAIRAAFEHQTFLSPTIARQMLQQFSVAGSVVESNGRTSRDVATLNQHDIEVLNRVARGFSDKEIAAQLFLSESAVKSRLRHIYRRLGLKNRAQAVVFALEKGFLPSVVGNGHRGAPSSFNRDGAGGSFSE